MVDPWERAIGAGLVVGLIFSWWVLGCLCTRGVARRWLSPCFYLALVWLGMVTVWALHVGSGAWIASGVSLSILAIGGVWDHAPSGKAYPV